MAARVGRSASDSCITVVATGLDRPEEMIVTYRDQVQRSILQVLDAATKSDPETIACATFSVGVLANFPLD